MLTAAGNLGTVPNMKNVLNAHKTEAQHRQNILHDAAEEGPTMHPDTNKTRYICTGKVFSLFNYAKLELIILTIIIKCNDSNVL